MIVESNLSLLDQSRPLESVIEDFQLLNRQVPVDLDYDTLDAYASGREAGHLGNSSSAWVAYP